MQSNRIHSRKTVRIASDNVKSHFGKGVIYMGGNVSNVYTLWIGAIIAASNERIQIEWCIFNAKLLWKNPQHRPNYKYNCTRKLKPIHDRVRAIHPFHMFDAQQHLWRDDVRLRLIEVVFIMLNDEPVFRRRVFVWSVTSSFHFISIGFRSFVSVDLSTNVIQRNRDLHICMMYELGG